MLRACIGPIGSLNAFNISVQKLAWLSLLVLRIMDVPACILYLSGWLMIHTFWQRLSLFIICNRKGPSMVLSGLTTGAAGLICTNDLWEFIKVRYLPFYINFDMEFYINFYVSAQTVFVICVVAAVHSYHRYACSSFFVILFSFV